MTNKWVLLAVGGILGTFLRYSLAGLVYDFLGTRFPYGTLVVNLTGCALIGFLSTLAEEKFLISSNGRLLLMTGFCGAYTTFSTFMLETANLIKDGEFFLAFANLGASIVAGFIAFEVGVFLGKVI